MRQKPAADRLASPHSRPLRSSVLVELRSTTQGDAAPTELRIFAAGENASTKGTFLFDAKAVKSVMAAAATRGVDFPFDYNHGSTDPLGMLNPEMSGKAAGWCSLEVRKGELWAVNIRWTESALSAIEAKEWRYISPTFCTDKDGRVVEILAIALTNTPALNGLEPLVAASAVEAPVDGWMPMCLGRSCCTTSLCCQACPCKVLCASLCYGCAVPGDPPDSADGGAMQMSARESGAAWEKSVTDKALSALKKERHMDKVFLSAVGLSEAASDTDFLATVTRLKADKEQVAAEVVRLSARLSEIETAEKTREVDALVEAAVKEGKITPVSAPAYKTLSAVQLKAIFEKSPKVVSTTAAAEVQTDTTTVQLTDGEKKNLALVHGGITPEAYLKHKADLIARGVINA